MLAHQGLYGRVVVHDIFGHALALGGRGGVAARRGVGDGAHLHRELLGVAGGFQGGAQALACRGLVERLALDTNHPVRTVAGYELGL